MIGWKFRDIDALLSDVKGGHEVEGISEEDDREKIVFG